MQRVIRRINQYERFIVFAFREHESNGGLGDVESSFKTELERDAYCEYLDKIGVEYQVLDCEKRTHVEYEPKPKSAPAMAGA